MAELLLHVIRNSAVKYTSFPTVRLNAPKSIQPDFRIRKARAYALLRLLTHPRFTHLEVGC